ncbi:MAG: hypothetical protein QOK18_4974 [Mycobacterium sp.]|nr:hypothetical protein [Mycobacterium sp.]
MQCCDAVLDVDVHDHGGVLSVRSAGYLGVPAGLDQTHESVDGAREWWGLLGHAVTMPWSRFQSVTTASW